MNLFKLFRYLFSSLIIACLCTCTLLEQKDFVISKDLTTGKGERIYYDVF
jgi:hypothetical protein